MILISASGLGRQFAGDPVFNDLKFEVRAGERIGEAPFSAKSGAVTMTSVSR